METPHAHSTSIVEKPGKGNKEIICLATDVYPLLDMATKVEIVVSVEIAQFLKRKRLFSARQWKIM